jgi:hypothetical protein
MIRQTLRVALVTGSFLLFVGFLSFAAGQNPAPATPRPKVLAPHQPVPPMLGPKTKTHKPPVPRSMIGGLWMSDANFRSTIYVKNIVKFAPLTVSPVLYLSNGKAIKIPDLTLEPSATSVIDVNAALRDQGIAPWATLYGYVEIQYQWAWDALCVTVRSVNAVDSLIFTSGLRPSGTAPGFAGQTPAVHLVEGMWWKQESAVSGLVALSNISSQPISARVTSSDNRANTIASHTVTVSPHGTKLVKLPELQSAGGSQGGIQVRYDGPDEALIAHGHLEDDSAGYSANIPFLPSPPANREYRPTTTFAELGLMTGAADPMMQFPAGTVFTPYSLMHNVSDQPIAVNLSLYWMEAAAPRSASLPSITLQPHQTLNLDLPRLLPRSGIKNFNGSVNLIVETNGNPYALLLTSGSVDQRNTYVFEVLPRGAMEGVGKSLGYWSIDKGDDTMVNLWNAADEAQDLVFTLFFAGGHYKYPIHLGPRATLMFNVSEIVRNQIPDVDGNIIPANVHDGSADLTGPLGETQHLLVAFDAAIYNVQKATCGYTCIQCYGTVDSWVTADPWAVGVGGQTQLTFTLEWSGSTGDQDITNGSSWTSDNTPVATVSAGLTSGISAGSATLTAKYAPEPESVQSCGDPPTCENPPHVPPVGNPPGAVGCPSSVAVNSTTPYTLANYVPPLLTGIGIETGMQVGPGPTDWDYAQISESLVQKSNDCPATISNVCTGNSVFTVGAAYDSPYLLIFQPTENIFWDRHTSTFNSNVLGGTGVNSCTVVCTQTYSCNGKAVSPSFTITYTYNATQVNSHNVTSVSVTKN